MIDDIVMTYKNGISEGFNLLVIREFNKIVTEVTISPLWLTCIENEFICIKFTYYAFIIRCGKIGSVLERILAWGPETWIFILTQLLQLSASDRLIQQQLLQCLLNFTLYQGFEYRNGSCFHGSPSSLSSPY